MTQEKTDRSTIGKNITDAWAQNLAEFDKALKEGERIIKEGKEAAKKTQEIANTSEK